jgi:hypothetical protein
VALPGNKRLPNSSAITFKVISRLVMDMMIPQGMQKITPRRTVGFCEWQNTDPEGMVHTTIQDNSSVGVSWESTDTGSPQGDRDDEDAEVHVLWNLAVTSHEASVDVLTVGESRLAADQVLETSKDLTTVVEDGVGNGSGVDGEERAIVERHGGGKVSW